MESTIALASIRVMIVDDSAAVRQGLESILRASPGMTVVATAVNGEQAIDGVAEHAPDVVLMDSKMPDMNGVEATRRIKEAWPTVQVLFLTVHPSHIDAGLAAGADAALLKDVDPQELVTAIRELASPPWWPAQHSVTVASLDK